MRVQRRARFASLRAIKGLKSNAKHVAHAILDREGRDGMPPGVAAMTLPEIAEASGLSRATAARMVRELEDSGVVQVERILPLHMLPNGRRTAHGVNLYTFDWQKVAELAPVVDEVVLDVPGTSASRIELAAVSRQLEDERTRREQLERERAADAEKLAALERLVADLAAKQTAAAAASSGQETEERESADRIRGNVWNETLGRLNGSDNDVQIDTSSGSQGSMDVAVPTHRARAHEAGVGESNVRGVLAELAVRAFRGAHYGEPASHEKPGAGHVAAVRAFLAREGREETTLERFRDWAEGCKLSYDRRDSGGLRSANVLGFCLDDRYFDTLADEGRWARKRRELVQREHEEHAPTAPVVALDVPPLSAEQMAADLEALGRELGWAVAS